MARRTKRGFISLSADTAARLRAFCELHGVAMGAIVEQVVKRHLAEQPEDLLGDDVRVARLPAARVVQGGRP